MNSKKIGPRSPIRAALFAFFVLYPLTNAPPLRGNDSFLFPGITLENVRFEVGAWCRYLVCDEAMGVIDSTAVYVGVPERRRSDQDEYFWVEIESGPYGAPGAERETFKALISSEIKNLEPGDSLCHYIKNAYIRKGTGAIETADPASIKRLVLSNPTSDSTWTQTMNNAVFTPAGRFLCQRRKICVDDNREIPMGRVTLIKRNQDCIEVWTSPEVPLFGVVKCVIERVRDTKTVPRVPGIPDKGMEKSRTTIDLLGSGSDAKPIMTIN